MKSFHCTVHTLCRVQPAKLHAGSAFSTDMINSGGESHAANLEWLRRRPAADAEAPARHRRRHRLQRRREGDLQLLQQVRLTLFLCRESLSHCKRKVCGCHGVMFALHDARMPASMTGLVQPSIKTHGLKNQ